MNGKKIKKYIDNFWVNNLKISLNICKSKLDALEISLVENPGLRGLKNERCSNLEHNLK